MKLPSRQILALRARARTLILNRDKAF